MNEVMWREVMDSHNMRSRDAVLPSLNPHCSAMGLTPMGHWMCRDHQCAGVTAGCLLAEPLVLYEARWAAAASYRVDLGLC